MIEGAAPLKIEKHGRALVVACIDYTGSHVAAIAEVSVERVSGAVKVHRIWRTISCDVAVQPEPTSWSRPKGRSSTAWGCRCPSG
jgi:isoquinoline 1-oxidoreductase beta subunit